MPSKGGAGSLGRQFEPGRNLEAVAIGCCLCSLGPRASGSAPGHHPRG